MNEQIQGAIGAAQAMAMGGGAAGGLAGSLAGSLVSPLLGLAVGVGTKIGSALYNSAFAPKPKPHEKSLIRLIKTQGGKVAAEAAAAFLDTGKHASDILKSNGFKAAASLVGANPTTATVAAILAGSGVGYALIRKFKSIVSRKGGASSITRKHNTRTKTTKKIITSLTKPSGTRRTRTRSRGRRSSRRTRSTRSRK